MKPTNVRGNYYLTQRGSAHITYGFGAVVCSWSRVAGIFQIDSTNRAPGTHCGGLAAQARRWSKSCREAVPMPQERLDAPYDLNRQSMPPGIPALSCPPFPTPSHSMRRQPLVCNVAHPLHDLLHGKETHLHHCINRSLADIPVCVGQKRFDVVHYSLCSLLAFPDDMPLSQEQKFPS